MDADAPIVQDAHFSHGAGAVVGFFLGNVLLGLRNQRSYKTWERAIWWCSLLIFIVLFLAGIVINVIL